jgi:hypothetical protein
VNPVVPVQNNVILFHDHRIFQDRCASKFQAQAIGDRTEKPLVGEQGGNGKDFQLQSQAFALDGIHDSGLKGFLVTLG